jgi:hypothetical protein
LPLLLGEPSARDHASRALRRSILTIKQIGVTRAGQEVLGKILKLCIV